MYEHRTQRVVSRQVYIRRQFRHFAAACGLLALSLGAGAIGYHVIEGQPWIESVYCATMILTGMGPASEVKTNSGKLFVTGYALFSGVVFLTAASVIIAPFLHRLIHTIHADPS